MNRYPLLLFGTGMTVCGLALIYLVPRSLPLYLGGSGSIFVYYFSFVPGFAIALFSTSFTLLLYVSPQDEFTRMLYSVAHRIPNFLFHFFFTALFCLNLYALVVFLLFPGYIMQVENDAINDIQIVGCIACAGMLGGFIRQIQGHLKPTEIHQSKKDEQNKNVTHESYYVKFWSSIFSIFSSLFVSLVLFLLLRAGILKSVTVDTFNVYGFTGVAAVTGYFSDNLIRRLTGIYDQLLGASVK